MTLDEVRLLKDEIKRDLEFKQAELAEIEDEVARLETAENFQEAERRDAAVAYFDRLTALLNDLTNSREVRVAFRKEGEKKWTNILPPCRQAQNALREVGTMMILDRLSRRAAAEKAMVVLVEEEVENA